MPKGAYERAGEGFFRRMWSDRIREKEFKLKERSRLDIRKKILNCESVEALEQVAQLSCGGPTSAVFKARLDEIQSNMV